MFATCNDNLYGYKREAQTLEMALSLVIRKLYKYWFSLNFLKAKALLRTLPPLAPKNRMCILCEEIKRYLRISQYFRKWNVKIKNNLTSVFTDWKPPCARICACIYLKHLYSCQPYIHVSRWQIIHIK